MLQDCGGSERIDRLWTMTSWAAPYVSTIRRASSASPMCLRDLCTSLSTQCEAAAEWDEDEEEEEKPTKQKVSHHALEHQRQRWKGVRVHMHWPTPMIHTSTANVRVTAAEWRLICEWAEKKRQINVAVGAFPATQWNNRFKNELPCRLHDLPFIFPFSTMWSIIIFLITHYNKQLQ